ncbi:uncharacterized protein B0H18DRAFT_967157 [Fomitopsis serialis]|uniref:uncharacterized protein n=1 Tax=Fomitopsis serialis TaxID=139415 RepID=UPI00200798ED|nr:uncharacterized protein B0H18DRAFT_967157 [Neoantrodia serialis]KAH9938435.1 hypothetical protein B0H18DRAFT_967157 [Neoantrodia serialis]
MVRSRAIDATEPRTVVLRSHATATRCQPFCQTIDCDLSIRPSHPLAAIRLQDIVMNKRQGGERIMGLGGGLVSQESQRNLKIAEDLCQKRKPKQALPYLVKAMEDPNNLDADVQFSFLQPNLNMSIKVLEDAERKGRATLQSIFGPRVFDDDSDGDEVGRFWTLIETRPYMRVLQAIVRIAFEKGDYNKSANTMIEMLRLCPGDNMGQRQWLGSVLLQAGRNKEALSFAQAWLQPRIRETGEAPPRGGCAFKAPSPDPIPQAEFEKMSDYCDGDLLYTGALAAFKIWGSESLLARQYLRLGAKNNFSILMRILGKVTRPHALNNLPRTPNGPEQAHDYLWLTQNLWEKPDVWAWADGDEAKAYVRKTCSRAGCEQREERSVQFKRCSACKRVSYCSPQCQKSDWKAHKPACKDYLETKEMTRAMMQG